VPHFARREGVGSAGAGARRSEPAAAPCVPREGGEWPTLSNIPVAVAEQVSVEADGAAGSRLKRLRLRDFSFQAKAAARRVTGAAVVLLSNRMERGTLAERSGRRHVRARPPTRSSERITTYRKSAAPLVT
jgi:hypothetical protein